TVTRRVKARNENEARLMLRQLLVRAYRQGDANVIAIAVGGENRSAELRVTVPRSMRESAGGAPRGGSDAAELAGRDRRRRGTAGGAIKRERIGGSVNATTAGGEIDLGALGGSAQCRTAGGAIRAQSIRGEAVLETAGGDITAGTVGGPVRALTAGGAIHVTQ